MRSQFFKRNVLVWIGRLLMVIGLVFVAVRFWDSRQLLNQQVSDIRLWILTFALSFIYGLMGLLLASGWWQIIRGGLPNSACFSWKTAWPLYGKTQIAKYIPGNIFHIAGRHVLSARKGVPHSLLVAAASLEILMVVIATGLLGLLVASHLHEALTHVQVNSTILLVMVIGLILALLICITVVIRKNIQLRIKLKALLAAQIYYLVFFVGSTVLFFIQTAATMGNHQFVAMHFGLIVGAYALSWVVGFLTPGAAAGLGVRETLLVVLLSGVFPSGLVLLSALLFRVVTTVGDLIFYVIALLYERHCLR